MTELREYGQIIRRRWWWPVVLGGLVGAISLAQLQPWRPAPPSYAAALRLLVGVLPATDQPTTAYDPRYYAWLTSEYLVDDFTEVVRSSLFAQNVSQRLAQQAITVPPNTIQGSAASGKQHRIITINFAGGDREQLVAIADAVAAELAENAAAYFRQLGTEGAGVTLIDGPSINEVRPSLRQRLDLPLRVGLGFLVGLGLIFWLDYLDTSVRNRQELEALGLAVIGEIPRHK